MANFFSEILEVGKNFFAASSVKKMSRFEEVSPEEIKRIYAYFFPCVLIFLSYKTNRFHVAVRLFSNRSRRTSKCGKNISDTLGCASCATFLFLPHFDVICDLLLNRRTATWNQYI